MSINKDKKADIIYTRLYQEYGEWNTWAEFAKEFGITRQQIYTRRKEGKLYEREIKMVFPDINEEWLNADTYEDLYELPVKTQAAQNEGGNVDPRIVDIKNKIAEIERHKDDPKTLEQKQDVLLEFLVDHVASLSEVLQSLVHSEKDSD